MEHLGTKRLETKKLVLRQFCAEDAEMMFANWASDPEVNKYLTWPLHKSAKDSALVLEDWISHYNEPDYYHWGIELKETGELIGSIGPVAKKAEIKMLHMGYCISRKWWNKGITSEALAALITFFFEDIGINRIEAIHDPRNPNSGKVMTKCGMKYEGTMREADRNNKGICDAAMYAILRSDYFANKA